jgi:hypothetical protein
VQAAGVALLQHRANSGQGEHVVHTQHCDGSRAPVSCRQHKQQVAAQRTGSADTQRNEGGAGKTWAHVAASIAAVC